MGRRIQTTLHIIRLLRHSEPKHSFEHAVANILLGVACVILAALRGLELWLLFVVVFVVSILVFFFRAWRYNKRETRDLLREYEEATGMKVEVD